MFKGFRSEALPTDEQIHTETGGDVYSTGDVTAMAVAVRGVLFAVLERIERGNADATDKLILEAGTTVYEQAIKKGIGRRGDRNGLFNAGLLTGFYLSTIGSQMAWESTMAQVGEQIRAAVEATEPKETMH